MVYFQIWPELISSNKPLFFKQKSPKKTVAYLGLLMFSCPGFLMDKKYDFYHGKGMEKQGSDNGVAKYVDFDKGEFKMQCKSSEGTQIII